jgi:hypothetical protein
MNRGGALRPRLEAVHRWGREPCPRQLDQLHALGQERGFNAGRMDAGVFPAVGDRRAVGVFAFDADFGYAGKGFQKDGGLGADQKATRCRTMTFDDDYGAHAHPCRSMRP